MGKRQQKTGSEWKHLLKGNGITIGIYLIGVALVSWFMLNGFIQESYTSSMIALLSAVAAFCGGLLWIRKTNLAPLAAMLLAAALFVIELFAIGGCIGGGYSGWTIRCWAVLLCIFLGNILAGVFGKKRSHRRKWK